MARKSRKSRKSARKPVRRSQPKGYMASSNGKAVTHAVLGMGVAAVADTSTQINDLAGKLPGGASSVTAVAFLAASMLSKKAGTKKMLQSMAFGAAGFAVIDHYKGGRDWDVRQLMPKSSNGSDFKEITAPRQTAPSRSVQGMINNSYVN
jgi:hypothetical protein